MSFLPDPTDIRAVADRIAGHAAATRTRAAVLARATTAAGWQGRAATAFEGSAHDVVRALHTAATELDHAASALRQHAHNVEVLLADLRRVGIDLRHSGHDLVVLLRDGTEPVTLIDHPARLLHDGASLVADGGHLVVDGARTAKHVASAAAHGAHTAVDSALSSVGL